MTVDELLKYVHARSGFLPRTFSRWVRSSDRFREFVEEYKDKTCAKFAEAKSDPEPDEKLKDTLFELEIAYLALRASRFSVKYELYGDGPDFTLTSENGVVFNIETKRIRKTREEKRLEAWRAEVARGVRSIPSALAVAVDIGVYDELPRGINAASREESDPKKIDELSALLDLLGRLECKKSEVIDYIVRTVRAEEKSISVDGIARYSVPSFDGEVELALSKPSGKPSSNHTTFNGGTFPTFFTTKEWEQFKNLVFPQRVQRIPGMINVLTINTDSATHDKYALMEEIEEDFKERVAQGNVTEQMKKLSGILFRGAWENLLWLNEVTCCPIPKSIAGALQQLTCD